MRLEEKLKLACEDARDVLDDLGIKYRTVTDVTINYKHPSWWGRCTRKKVTSTEFTYSIEINVELLANNVEWEELLNTVIHEYLHCHEDRFKHTGEWKRCAELINREYPIYNIKRTASCEERGVDRAALGLYKYRVDCDRCGTIGYHKRAGKAVQYILAHPHSTLYRCGKCKSGLTVTVL